MGILIRGPIGFPAMPKNSSTVRTWTGFGILFGLLLIIHVWSHIPDGKLHLFFLDIGQGDSALIVTPKGKQIMIDGGPDLSTLEQIGDRMSYFDRSLDLLILTHPHLDHLASFPAVLNRYDVDTFLLAGTNASNGRYKAILRDLADGKPKSMLAEPGTSLNLGEGISLDILWPPKSWYGKNVTNENNASVTLKLHYRGHTALFTGDDELPVEQALLALHINLKADILKVGHHGSDTSSSEKFLQAVDPDLAIISVGEGNLFHHPKQSVLDRLDRLGIPYKRTDLDGTIEIVWE